MQTAADVTRLDPVIAASPRQLVARVRSVAGAQFGLWGEGRRFAARRAVGCLLRPEPGDRVLAVELGSEVWILSVLERDRCQTGVIDADGSLTLRAGAGDLSLDAVGSVRMRATEAIELDAARLGVRAVVADLIMRRLSVLGECFDGRFDRLRVVGRLFEGLVQRLGIRARSSHREIDELDCTRAGRIDSRAVGDMSLQAGNLLGRAEGLARIDGKQIHLG